MVSGVRSFFRAAVSEPAVVTLYRAMVTVPKAQKAVLEQIQNLSRLEVDRRYQNPNDTALAVLLLLTIFTDSDYGLIAAELVDRAPQCWYAKKIARRILNPAPIASNNLEDLPRELASTRTFSTERMTPMNLSLQLEWHWSHRKANIQASMTKDSLVEVLA